MHVAELKNVRRELHHFQVRPAGYESRFASVLGAGFHEIAPYIIMIIVLLIRPYGFFGTKKVERI